MTDTESPLTPLQPKELGLTPALVVHVAEGRATLRLLDSALELAGARSAVPGYLASVGDRVLVCSGRDGVAYVVGVLHASARPALASRAGARAELDEARDVLLLRAADGALLCELCPDTGGLTVHAHSALSVRAEGQDLELSAERLRLASKSLQIDTQVLSGRAQKVEWTVERWHLTAARLQERVRDKVVDVQESLATRAGQARTIVSEVWELTSRRTRMRSKENTSIDGRRILLG